jgi:alpha-D-ribose 1-methylphosphonate 5-triphosphate diphosphatase
LSSNLCLANAQLVLGDRVLKGAVTIENGIICNISEGEHIPAGAINCENDFVIPGLVELHTDNLERHIEPRPDVDWPHLPALIAHDAEIASTGMFKISHFLHLRAEICSETLLEELATFGTSDRVGIVSLMDHTPGQRQFRDLSVLKTYVGKKRGLSDQEFKDHVEKLLSLQKRFGTTHEAGAVSEALRLGAVLASHDDTTEDHVATSFANGIGFAEFPTTIEAAQACRTRGIAVMMGAPNLIRGGSHSGNVAASDLARTDLLDIVSSDYVPSALLAAAFRLAQIWNDLPRAIATVTHNPAKAVRLHDRGILATSLRGDVLRVRKLGQTALLCGVWSQGNKVG